MPVRTAKTQPRDVGECGLHPVRKRLVRSGNHPGRGALVELKFRDVANDARHDLDGAGARADHRHPLAREVDVVVPLRGMESGASEIGESFDVGKARNVQRAGPRDEELRNVLLPGVGEHMPAVLGVIPVRSGGARVEPDVTAQTVLLGDAPEVIQDLRLRREQFAPGRLGLERERVQVRRHIARAVRIAVVAPGAAYLVGLLQDQEVHALALQRDGHAKTGEAGADDQRTGVHGLLGAAFGSLLGGNRHRSGSFLGTPVPDTFGSQVNRLSLHSQRC